MYLDLTKQMNGKQCGIHLPILFWGIDESEVLDESEKSKIVGSKGKLVKVWTLHLVPAAGISVDLRFKSNEEARKYLNDCILNA